MPQEQRFVFECGEVVLPWLVRPNGRDERLETLDFPSRPILSGVRWIALLGLFKPTLVDPLSFKSTLEQHGFL